MPKALCVFGMVAAGLMVLLFGLDLAIGLPFGKANVIMDVGFIVAAALLGYASFTTYREIP